MLDATIETAVPFTKWAGEPDPGVPVGKPLVVRPHVVGLTTTRLAIATGSIAFSRSVRKLG